MRLPIKRFTRAALFALTILCGLSTPARAIDPDQNDPVDTERKLRVYARSYLEKSPLRVSEISKAVAAPITLLPEDLRFTRSGGRASITWGYTSPVALSALQASVLRDRVEELIAAIALKHPTEPVQLLTEDSWSRFYLSLNPRSATRAVFVEVKSRDASRASARIMTEPVNLAPVYPFWAGNYGYRVGVNYQPFFTPVASLPLVPVWYGYPYSIPWASPYVIPFPGYLPRYDWPSAPVVYSPPVAVTAVSVPKTTNRPADFASLVSDARERMVRNDLAGAVESLARVVEKDGRSPVAWYLKAAAEFQLGRTEDAKESALRGKACEMVLEIPAAEIAVALERIQGRPRQFLEHTAYPDNLARAKEIVARPVPHSTVSTRK